MCEHTGRDPSRDEVVVVAALHVCLHDHACVYCSVRRVPTGAVGCRHDGLIMDLQTLMTGLIVLAAAAYVLRSAVKVFTSQGCASGCGKCETPPERIELGIRKSL